MRRTMLDGLNGGPDGARSRRAVVRNGLLLAGVLAVPSAVSAAMQRLTQQALEPVAQPPLPRPEAAGFPAPAARPLTSAGVVRPHLLRRALAALDAQGSRVRRDRLAIADFAAPSGQPKNRVASGKGIEGRK